MIKLNIELTPATGPKSRPHRLILAAMAAALMLPVLALAAPADIPNAFTDGDPILAEEFNENFDAIAAAIDDNDARIALLETESAPIGAVMFFNGNNCPEGWEELTEAHGRVLVGMNGSGGTLLHSEGTALDDMESPSHGHSTPGFSGNTGVTAVTHTHNSGTYEAANDGGHNHQWLNGTATYTSTGTQAGPFPEHPLSIGPGVNVTDIAGNLYTANVGDHNHDVSGNSGPASNTNHQHTVSIPNGVSGGGTGHLPYLQLLVCTRTM